jgi:hypothetical protein
MVSIAPIVIGCIDYLAHGNIFMRAMSHPIKKHCDFFCARKAVDARWEVVNNQLMRLSELVGYPTK